MRNCRIHHQRTVSGAPGTRWLGFYFHEGNNIVLENNDIYNNPGGGGQFYPGPLNGVIFRGNRVHHNNTIQTGTSSVGGVEIAEASGFRITNVQIYNNLFYNNNTAGAGLSPGLQIHASSSVQAWNNTAYGNKDYGIIIWYDASNTVVRNNIAYGNGSGGILDQGSATVRDHNLESNPNFVNPAAFDFNLQAGSSAVDAGVTLSQVATDIRMTPRPQAAAYDIGAYEAGTSSSSAPAPPVNLRVR
jgi:parallel beta-helix repeat protein